MTLHSFPELYIQSLNYDFQLYSCAKAIRSRNRASSFELFSFLDWQYVVQNSHDAGQSQP